MGVVIVAPTTAVWPRRAAATLGRAGVHVALVNDLRAIGALASRGGVRGIVIDVSIRGPRWSSEEQRLRQLAPRARILVVRDDHAADEPGVIAWPHDSAEALDLLAGADSTA